MLEFTRLKKNLKKDKKGFKKIKIGLLTDSSSQLLNIAIKGTGIDNGIDFDIFEADYNQINRQIFDSSSDFYSSKPDVTVISISTNRIVKEFYALPYNERNVFWIKYTDYIKAIFKEVLSKLNAKIIFLGFNEIDDRVFGNYSNKTGLSFIYQIRKINLFLMELAQKEPDLFICDCQSLYNEYGTDFILDRSSYIRSDLIWSLDFLPVLSKNIVDIIIAMYGGSKKCLILDLDNTVWGGVIGDDGIDSIQIGDLGVGKAFTELQYWIKELKKRGVIICVCSKNTMEIAKEPFLYHPDMILRDDDIAVFVANWESKVDNIRYIQKVINIGFDSMVFLDDNPFEREVVKNELPEIEVPDLPEDPVDYLQFIKRQNLFEISTFSEVDLDRTQQYKEEADRTIFQKSFKNEDEYLESLNMVCHVEEFNSFNIPRVAQLLQRSNQFNLRTIRYSETDVQKIANDPKFQTLAFNLKDKFGNSGLISAVILEIDGNKAFINTWVMSCRVLKRGVENFILNTVVDTIQENNCEYLVGEYIQTKKNAIVKDLFKQLGFHYNNNNWKKDIIDFKALKTFIKTI